MHNITNEHGKEEVTWKIIHNIVELAEQKGEEFCSFSRGWDAQTAAAKAQGDQTLNTLLEKYTESDIIKDPIKRNIVRILSNESLYKIPSTHQNNSNAQDSYKEHVGLVNKPEYELSETEHRQRSLQNNVKRIFEVAPDDPSLQQECADQILNATLLNNQNENRQSSASSEGWNNFVEEQTVIQLSLKSTAVSKRNEVALDSTVKLTPTTPKDSRPWGAPATREPENPHNTSRRSSHGSEASWENIESPLEDNSSNDVSSKPIINNPPESAIANSPGGAALNNSLLEGEDLIQVLKLQPTISKHIVNRPTPRPRTSLNKVNTPSAGREGEGR
ncbi:hypothetical protein [Candidatus Tisiphia endosymbiont of Nemotelus uliginosus]|uniref:hypothetical protein n=1 Tax=Candidatus Tisiphia endosymbiont of Nemotelus uliginosus TaxID=3077926 RepID=UPI0035C8F210